MEKYITVTSKKGKKISLSLSAIIEVRERRNGTMIVTDYAFNMALAVYIRCCVYARESYAEVIEKIRQSNKAG